MNITPPYAPAWLDRVTAHVDRLPLPAWATYTVLGLLLSALLAGLAWAAGAPQQGLSLLAFLRPGLTYAWLLGLVHYLDRAAAQALARFRPALRLDALSGDPEVAYTELRYRFTTLPAGPTLLASVLGMVYGAAILAANVYSAVLRGVADVPLAVLLVDVGFSLVLYFLLGAVVYHTLHQLRWVNRIYTCYARIDPFQQRPLYALSGLTARTALGLGVAVYVWFQTRLTTPGASTTADLVQLAIWAVILLVTFIWPLWGAHTLLEREKQRLQDDVGRRLQATTGTLRACVDGGDLADISTVKTALDALVAEQTVVDKLRTWPWRPETINGLVAAFLVPIVIWLAQRLLERFGV